MKCVIVASGLVFLMAGSAQAMTIMPCETFVRSDTHAPQFVREYLDDSKELLVRVCDFGPQSYYFGESNPVRDGNVCRYTAYELSLLHTSPPRLERKATSTLTYMLVSESSTCPLPLPKGTEHYAATSNVPQGVFERLIHFWRDAITSPASFHRAFSGVSNANGLLNAVLKGESNRLTVLSVNMSRDLGLWKSYDLLIADPYDRFRLYHVTASRWFGRTYRISNVTVGII